MAHVKAANVTKFDNGGSGDNVISDGFIKSVEKVWIDSYAVTTAIASSDTIKIGIVPKGKKLIDIQVTTPQLYTLATACTIHVGTSSSMAQSATSLGELQANGVAAGTDDFDGSESQTCRLNGAYIATEAGTEDMGIYIKILGDAADPDPTNETGTIRSIIKYT